MTNKRFTAILEKRTVQFADDIINLSSKLPSSTQGLLIRNQLTKSGTNVGANYRKTNRSRNPRDFKNMIKVNLAEASEIDYWLE